MSEEDDKRSGGISARDASSIENLSKELELLRIKLDRSEKVHDPGIVVSRTSNLLSFLTFIVVLLGVTGGTGLYIQGRQADQLNSQSEELNTRLESFRAELNDIVNRSFSYMDRQLLPIEKSMDEQRVSLNERFATLENDLRGKFERDQQERVVSVSLQEPIVYPRERRENSCVGHIVFMLTNNTPYLTEMVQAQQFSRLPLVAGNVARIKDWDDVSTEGMSDKPWRMLVGNDVRPYYVSIAVGRQYWPQLRDEWTSDREYPFKFVLSYLKRGVETASISIEQPIKLDRSFVQCAVDGLATQPQ